MEQRRSLESSRPSLLRATTLFALSGVVSSVLVSAAVVYLLGWHDTKFQGSLGSAFEVELLGMAIGLVAAVILFLLTVWIRVRGEQLSPASTWRAVVLGACFPIGLAVLGRALQHLDPESAASMISAVGYLALYPVVGALLVKKHSS